MPFEPGKSGNPGGRPKAILPDGRTLAEVARTHTLEAVETLVSVMKDGESDAARVSAAVAVLDRGWGKPAQPVEADEAFVDLASELIAAKQRLAARDA